MLGRVFHREYPPLYDVNYPSQLRNFTTLNNETKNGDNEFSRWKTSPVSATDDKYKKAKISVNMIRNR